MDIKEVSEGLVFEEYINSEKKHLAAKLENEGLMGAYRSMLKSPDGRRVIWDILEKCRVFHTTMTGNSWTYFNEGSRSIGLYLMSILNVITSLEDIMTINRIRPEDDDGGK
jgi:hypothetical protein